MGDSSDTKAETGVEGKVCALLEIVLQTSKFCRGMAGMHQRGIQI
jgi:hypothetical protein